MMDNFFKSGSPVRLFVPTFQQRARESEFRDSTSGQETEAMKAEARAKSSINAALKRTVRQSPVSGGDDLS
jgi:hypothetical protein